MSLIVDASVAVKWFADEPASDAARALGDGREDLIAPELVVAEVGNALWKKCLQGVVSEAQAVAALSRLPTLFTHLRSDVGLAPRAFELAITLTHPIYDCFYLALAERERAPLVSADKRLLAAAKRVKGITVRAL